MKILPDLLSRGLLVCLIVTLSACSQHVKKASDPVSPTLATASSEDGQTDDEFTYASPEPDTSAEEELAALSQPGAWENKSSDSNLLPPDAADYDYPVILNRQVNYYLDLFQGRQRNDFSRWLARSTQYVPFIKEELRKAGLPEDLAYLALIESGFNPTAYSPAQASGLWQFIEGTGRRYGLKVDSWVDERRDPVKSTKAAIQYLSFLYEEFGDWHLAVAAYNGGEGRIDSAIKTYGTEDFWELAGSEGLYLETKRYVPKLIAAIIIARHPEKYGFTDIDYQQPAKHDMIRVPGGTDLEAVAVSANTSVKRLRGLNCELLKNQTPPERKEFALRIPAGSKDLVAANLDKLHPVTATTFTTHTVKKGDTLTTICSTYGISKTALLKANSLRSGALKNGLRLQIPTQTTKYVLLKDGEIPPVEIAKAEKGRQLAYHKVQPGDTLSRIATQYNVPVKNLMAWNNLSTKGALAKGRQLAIYLDKPAPEAMKVVAQANSVPADVPTLSDKKKQTMATAQPTHPPEKPAVTLPQEKQSKQLTAATAQQNTSPQKVAGKPAKENTAKQAAVVAAKKADSQQKLTTGKKQELPATWYKVKNGDSLAAIAKKFQVSAQDLRQWNNLSGDNLKTGNKLLVKKG